jgi:hypothetical protein
MHLSCKCPALLSSAACLLLPATLGLACSSTSAPTQPDAGNCNAAGACCPAAAPSPTSCAPAETGLTCFYSGVAYTCAHCIPEAANDPLSWCMATPNAGCPIPAPGVGTPCDSPGLLCDYKFCAEGSEPLASMEHGRLLRKSAHSELHSLAYGAGVAGLPPAPKATRWRVRR